MCARAGTRWRCIQPTTRMALFVAAVVRFAPLLRGADFPPVGRHALQRSPVFLQGWWWSAGAHGPRTLRSTSVCRPRRTLFAAPPPSPSGSRTCLADTALLARHTSERARARALKNTAPTPTPLDLAPCSLSRWRETRSLRATVGRTRRRTGRPQQRHVVRTCVPSFQQSADASTRLSPLQRVSLACGSEASCPLPRTPSCQCPMHEDDLPGRCQIRS